METDVCASAGAAPSHFYLTHTHTHTHTHILETFLQLFCRRARANFLIFMNGMED